MYWTNSATSKYRKSRNSNSRLLSSGSSGILEWRTGSGVMRAERGGADKPTELLLLREERISRTNHGLIAAMLLQKTLSVGLCYEFKGLAHLFLRPVPLPKFPPTKVCRDGRAERLSCCLLGPLRPPGMAASYCGNHGCCPPTNSPWDFPPSPQWATMYTWAPGEESQMTRQFFFKQSTSWVRAPGRDISAVCSRGIH